MIYDISPIIDEELAVWPGDIAFSRQWQCRIKEGSNIDLSSMNTTVHLGAHADAPSHYHPQGDSIEKLSLEPYLGPCLLIDLSEYKKALIGLDVLEVHANWQGEKRLLFRTGSYPNPKQFRQDFKAFDPQLIAALGEAGVTLIGIDTPSFDPFDSKDLPAHRQLYRFGIRNLEGLVLESVAAGRYELIALPLSLKGFDASPVRAVLREI